MATVKNVLILLVAVNGLRGDDCPTLPNIGSPVNIFSVYFQNFFKAVQEKNWDSSLTLILFNSREVEDIYTNRFIWRLNYNDSKINYIGILSTFPVKSTPESEHNIVRFIQTSDIADAHKLLGLYEGTETEVLLCAGLKARFKDYFNKNPYTPANPNPGECGNSSSSSSSSSSSMFPSSSSSSSSSNSSNSSSSSSSSRPSSTPQSNSIPVSNSGSNSGSSSSVSTSSNSSRLQAPPFNTPSFASLAGQSNGSQTQTSTFKSTTIQSSNNASNGGSSRTNSMDEPNYQQLAALLTQLKQNAANGGQTQTRTVTTQSFQPPSTFSSQQAPQLVFRQPQTSSNEVNVPPGFSLQRVNVNGSSMFALVPSK